MSLRLAGPAAPGAPPRGAASPRADAGAPGRSRCAPAPAAGPRARSRWWTRSAARSGRAARRPRSRSAPPAAWGTARAARCSWSSPRAPCTGDVQRRRRRRGRGRARAAARSWSGSSAPTRRAASPAAREQEIPFYPASGACCCATAACSTPPRIDDYIAARRLRGAGPRPGDGPRGRPRRGQALGPARARRRRLPDRAQVGGLPPGRGRPQVRRLQRRRGRPRRVHGRRPARGQPPQRARGHDHRRLRHGRPRGPRVRAPGVPPRRRAHHAGDRAGARGRPARRRHPGQRLLLRRAREPRRRRLRVRRGERHDGLARGPARRAAPAPHPPLRARPVGPAHRPQQRRDLGQRAAHRAARRRVVPRPSAPRARPGTKIFSLVGKVAQHRPRRGADGHHPARDRLRRRRRHPATARRSRPCRPAAPRAAACRRTSSTCRWTSTRSPPRAR